MHGEQGIWIVGGAALVVQFASEVFAGFVAFGNASNIDLNLGLRILLFIAFGLTTLAILSLAYFTLLYTQQLHSGTFTSRRFVWTTYSVGVGAAVGTLGVSGTALTWLTLRRRHMPPNILHRDSSTWLFVWFGLWGASVVLQISLFFLLGLWTRSSRKKTSLTQYGVNSGVALPSMAQPTAPTERSLALRNALWASVPRSPNSTHAGSSIRGPSSIKTSAANSRTRLIGRNSARSSLDQPVAVPGEILTFTAFEQWDTSGVHHEMRAAMGALPITPRNALPTIPGSRPDSPANALDTPFEEVSTPSRKSPRTTPSTFAAVTPHEWSSSPPGLPPNLVTPLTPPSSPPNFSRPTSKGQTRALVVSSANPREELVHPLFRSSSPHPPPVATLGTSVTVSPTTRDPLTPKSLARLRNNNNSLHEQALRNVVQPGPKGHWRAMPSMDGGSTRPSTAGSAKLGSPGPSIVDETELPPILPGFVLGAGSRSSWIGYSSRKGSRKGKRASRTGSTS